MFDMLSNLTRAVVSVALAPVAIVVDTVMIPADSVNDRDAYARTGALLNNAAECVNEAVKPDKE